MSKCNTIKWSTEFSHTPKSRHTAKDILKHIPGPTKLAKKQIYSPLTAFMSFFTIDMMEEIVSMTNKKLQSTKHSEISTTEFKKFIAIIIAAGISKSNMESVEFLWDSKFSSPFYSSTMPKTRFRVFTSYLRFDDITTRAQRRTDFGDKLAPIRSIFDKFMLNCRKYM